MPTTVAPPAFAPAGNAPTAAGPSPRTVFVTGGTGYIGRALVAALGARGHRVRVVGVPEIRGAAAPARP